MESGSNKRRREAEGFLPDEVSLSSEIQKGCLDAMKGTSGTMCGESGQEATCNGERTKNLPPTKMDTSEDKEPAIITESVDDASCERALADGTECSQSFQFSNQPTLENIRFQHDAFVAERGWNQFHTPRNLLLALVGEVGEVAELFQWKGECQAGLPDWDAKEKERLGEELADVMIYLVRLADKCNIDLPKVTERKMELNAKKYPADLVYGSSKKYTEYQSKNQY
ncbi:dCTP pyrophosphatase 1-like [Paramacrobiotus metropolitanus]|uniref:dCTP pyrophosphatase 1-like n=1 Tax=Paramacrobiotus metropolitanus TaxID=2943436 RepID=UPI0024456D87|nr:dCTP pyrophosphatase 1-like [Paramacrobiotus metropolitanus]XP_055328254.1 dCTP pyrophosphatase 1-like [Paramacrobiotus metropolitanus]